MRIHAPDFIPIQNIHSQGGTIRRERKGGFGAALFSPLVILIVSSFDAIGDLPADFEIGINKC
jgi:hypothetical protein